MQVTSLLRLAFAIFSFHTARQHRICDLIGWTKKMANDDVFWNSFPNIDGTKFVGCYSNELF